MGIIAPMAAVYIGLIELSCVLIFNWQHCLRTNRAEMYRSRSRSKVNFSEAGLDSELSLTSKLE